MVDYEQPSARGEVTTVAVKVVCTAQMWPALRDHCFTPVTPPPVCQSSE